jgi:hypothetical protein
MLLRNSCKILKVIALRILQLRLRDPGGEGQAMHLYKAALMIRQARLEVGLLCASLVRGLPRKGLRRRALLHRLNQSP